MWKMKLAKTERWSFEAGTPSGMIRGGYSDKLIKTGDTVTINGFRPVTVPPTAC